MTLDITSGQPTNRMEQIHRIAADNVKRFANPSITNHGATVLAFGELYGAMQVIEIIARFAAPAQEQAEGK